MDFTHEYKSFNWVEGPISDDHLGFVNQIAARDEQSGAHQIFLGRVRADIINNEKVQYIDYSFYEELANTIIPKILDETIEESQLRSLHIWHSLGKVNAGQVSLFISATSSHRSPIDGFMHKLVQRIKDEIPVWGKEVSASGHYSWKKCTHSHIFTHPNDKHHA